MINLYNYKKTSESIKLRSGIDPMLFIGPQRWANIKPTLGQRLVLTG